MKIAKTDETGEKLSSATANIKNYNEIDFDGADEIYLKRQAEFGAHSAVAIQQQRTREFDTAAAKRRAEAGHIGQEQCKK